MYSIDDARAHTEWTSSVHRTQSNHAFQHNSRVTHSVTQRNKQVKIVLPILEQVLKNNRRRKSLCRTSHLVSIPFTIFLEQAKTNALGASLLQLEGSKKIPKIRG